MPAGTITRSTAGAHQRRERAGDNLDEMLYTERWEFVRPLVEGRRVLDVGPAELVGTVNRHKMDRWLHGRIAGVASQVVGLEREPEQVEALCELGYDIRLGDAEAFALDERFDVVFAGELIEHLTNPGRFLECARDHLEEGGRLVLTTPNRFSILAFYRLLRTGEVPRYEKELAPHVAYFDSDALSSLLGRHGYSEIEIGYVRWVGPPSRGPASRLLTSLAARFRPAMLPTLVATAAGS